MVGNKRDFCAGATERTARSFLIVPAVIGMIAVGLVAGGLLRNIPGMVTAARSRRLLNGTTPVQDFSITLPDGTETSLYAQCSLSKDVILSFVSTGCGQCLDELRTCSAGIPHGAGTRVAYLPITSEPQDMISAYEKSTKDPVVIGHVAEAVFTAFNIDEVPQLVVVNSDHRVIRHLTGFDPSVMKTLTGLLK